LPPQMPEREERRQQILTAQIAGGWLFPTALLQHAISDLDKLSIDLTELEAKRDLMVTGLQNAGYEVHQPEGTFYLLPKAPIDDDMAFSEILAAHKLFVMPGTICSIPGYFRITLTSSRERLLQSLEAFAAARASVSP
jgi:aspartate aminotransferase